MDDAQEIAQQIAQVRFTPVRLKGGYDMGEVDQLLDRLQQAATRGEPLEPLVAAARFTTVRAREGYDMQDVDAFLARLAPGATRPATADAPTGSVIEERRGWLARLLGR